jgi:hypothetical protein
VTDREPPQPQEPDEDRVVSRRVDNPTAAGPGDDRAYRAADPLPGSDPVDAPRGPTGGIAEKGSAPDDSSEPMRSE